MFLEGTIKHYLIILKTSSRIRKKLNRFYSICKRRSFRAVRTCLQHLKLDLNVIGHLFLFCMLCYLRATAPNYFVKYGILRCDYNNNKKDAKRCAAESGLDLQIEGNSIQAFVLKNPKHQLLQTVHP